MAAPHARRRCGNKILENDKREGSTKSIIEERSQSLLLHFAHSDVDVCGRRSINIHDR